MTRRRRVRLTRDLVLFSVGLVTFCYEIFRPGGADPGGLTGALAVLLSPAVMRYEEWPRRRDRDDR